jgi:hypothetical protein
MGKLDSADAELTRRAAFTEYEAVTDKVRKAGIRRDVQRKAGRQSFGCDGFCDIDQS